MKNLEEMNEKELDDLNLQICYRIRKLRSDAELKKSKDRDQYVGRYFNIGNWSNAMYISKILDEGQDDDRNLLTGTSVYCSVNHEARISLDSLKKWTEITETDFKEWLNKVQNKLNS